MSRGMCQFSGCRARNSLVWFNELAVCREHLQWAVGTVFKTTCERLRKRKRRDS